MDYTPIYSAVIKVARAMVVYQSHQERQAEVARLQQEQDLDEEEAEEEATSIFRIVREKVQRFMTLTSKETYAEPTPMDWIYEARTYGMYIRFNTPAGGTVNWVGDRRLGWRPHQVSKDGVPDVSVDRDVACIDEGGKRAFGNIDDGG